MTTGMALGGSVASEALPGAASRVDRGANLGPIRSPRELGTGPGRFDPVRVTQPVHELVVDP